MPAVTPNAGADETKAPGLVAIKIQDLGAFLAHPLCLPSQPLQKLLQPKELRGTVLC